MSEQFIVSEMTPWRGKWRRFWFGLQTVSGMRQRGYFAPSRYAAAGPRQCASSELERIFMERESAMRGWLARLDEYAAAFDAIREGTAPTPRPLPRPSPRPSPRWNQDWFPRMDAAIAYAIVRTIKPQRIVEVGTGHSTRFFCRAVSDGGLKTEILSIDPAPRAKQPKLPMLETVASLVQDVGVDPFVTLRSGDILSIDSGHVLMPGSDVDFLMNAVLPVLPPGVLVHFHDIFLPDPYPESWAWRGYNEQQAIAPLILLAGWDVVFSSRFALTRLASDVAQSVASEIPLAPGAFESSLWLRTGRARHAAGSP